MRVAHVKQVVICLAVLGALAACSKATAPAWTSVSAAGAERVVYLDTANILVNAGVVYVTLQTRTGGDAPDASGRPFGIVHAEANCRQHLLEPTALKEEQYGADGKRLGMRLVAITGPETDDVLKRACAGR
jgi:hypothetical protein